ncbi:RusA family crossover junction endodeoxyribonuclease [Prosthecobacter sp. SYSU 5D2]|uniref:RusA family crossover junction endodeoxyribonuclease n=1 Tax=Prosthecobacter sp. SYSU 5D2 TaxID=3134134 RepID=UPI0031FE69F5
MNTLEFFAQGLPKGQPRVKAVRRGNHAGVYDPGTANDWKTSIKSAAKDALINPVFPIFAGPVRVDATFIFPRPNAHYRGKAQTLRLDAPVYHSSKPDRDNLDKALMDALKDMQVLKDDALAASGTITKIYASPGQAAGVRVHILSLQQTQ